MTATQEKPVEPTKKKGKKKFLLIGLVLVVAIAAGAYFFVLKKPAKATKAVKTPAAPISYTMPSITTNLNDSHIVQVQMILELAPGSSKATVAHDLPQLNNAAILGFGSMSYSQLLPTSGRTQAAVAIAKDFNAVLHKGSKPYSTVQNILFSQFIVQ